MLDATNPIELSAAAIHPGSRRIRETYRGLMQRGLGSTEAASVVAHLNGLRVGHATWTLGEVNRMLFLRHLYRSGRLAEGPQMPKAMTA